MAIDGPSGAYDDDPERGGGPKPEKGHQHGRPDASHPADCQPAEVRSRAEYYEALRARDIRVAAAGGAESAASTARTRSAWDSEAAGDHLDPPPLDSLRVAPERAGHILDVARAPDDPPVFQANRRWRVHGRRDDVGITVIVQPDGRIWSAWPDAGSPGVVKNPRETQ